MESSQTSPELELIADLGLGLKLYMAPLDSLHEQDINARILPAAEHNTLTNNIKRRGRLESVPYCALIDNRIEIVSGHHRVLSARQAGLTSAPVLVDESGLSRAEIVAKQLAHNRLAGFDDPVTLRTLFGMLDDADLILQTGLANEMIEIPEVDLGTSITPGLDVGWRTVSLVFLPHQLANMKELAEMLPESEVVGVAHAEQFEAFVKAARAFGRLKNISSFSTAIAVLTEMALDALKDATEAATDEVSSG